MPFICNEKKTSKVQSSIFGSQKNVPKSDPIIKSNKCLSILIQKPFRTDKRSKSDDKVSLEGIKSSKDYDESESKVITGHHKKEDDDEEEEETGKNKCEEKEKSFKSRNKRKNQYLANSLASICIISHHPFFSTFRDCLLIIKKMIEYCNERHFCQKLESKYQRR